MKNCRMPHRQTKNSNDSRAWFECLVILVKERGRMDEQEDNDDKKCWKEWHLSGREPASSNMSTEERAQARRGSWCAL